MLGDGGSARRGRPRTDALRQKSVRVLGIVPSVRRQAAEDGRAPTAELSCGGVMTSVDAVAGVYRNELNNPSTTLANSFRSMTKFAAIKPIIGQ